MKKAVLAFLIVLCMAVAGCNTMQGLGKDIKSLGESLEGAADKD